jgi:hypothetical protein
VREFRDDAGGVWVVFLTARTVARDQHLPEEYREAWLAFESAHGEKRRVAPVPKDWESLTDQELSALCAQAIPPALRRKAALATEAAKEAVSLRRKLRSERNHEVRQTSDFRSRPEDRHA